MRTHDDSDLGIEIRRAADEADYMEGVVQKADALSKALSGPPATDQKERFDRAMYELNVALSHLHGHRQAKADRKRERENA